MKYIFNVPSSWWRMACERQRHPLACVSEEGKFIWVNEAWERLVGYSQRELEQLTWMQITVDSDVGGAAASSAELVEGERVRYTLAKRYIHKLGHVIPVQITVFRYPDYSAVFEAFIVEAIRESASKDQFDLLDALVKALEQRVARIEGEETVERSENNSSVINIGNSDPRWVAAIVITIVGVVGYLIYVGGWATHGGGAEPPRHHVETE